MSKAKLKIKKERMKPRGIRFRDDQWKKLEADAEKASATPSDVVRAIVDQHYEKAAR